MGSLCLASLFIQRQHHLSVPVFMGLAGLSVLLFRSKGWLALLIALSIGLACLLHEGNLGLQVSMRVETWRALLEASLDHPIVGNGFSLLTAPVVFSRFGTPLHSPHSDWISLAFHAGWPAVVLALLLSISAVLPLSDSFYRRGLQCSLGVFCAMAAVRNTVDQPGVVWVVFLLLYQIITAKGGRDANGHRDS